MSKLFPLIVGLTALMSPAQAGGIHDFNPTRPARAPQTSYQPRSTPTGNCYGTRDNSRICFMRLGNNRFSVAIQDVDKPAYPNTVLVDCNTRKYYSFGTLTKQELAVYTGAICEDNT